MTKYLFKLYAKVRWILSGEAADAKKALMVARMRDELKTRQHNSSKGINLNKTHAIEVQVIKAKNLQEPCEADFNDWESKQ